MHDDPTPLATIRTAIEIVDGLTFTPVPVRPRADGWTPAKQAAFLRWLWHLGMVGDAAAMVGMTRAGAYALRRRPGAASFAESWDLGVRNAGDTLMMQAIRRAVDGDVVALVRRGRLAGATRRYDTGLLLALLRRAEGVRAHRAKLPANRRLTSAREST